MLIQGILVYDIVLTVHILAVVLAFGVTFAYPVLDAYVRKSSPGDLVTLHRFQVVLTQRLIQPAMVVVLLAGLYLALDRYDLGKPWISAAFAILIVMFGLAGAVFTPSEKNLVVLAERDRQSGNGPSPEYEAQARRLAIFGSVWLLLVIAAIFVMTVKPGT
ncbi:MAG: hypothetical protein QOD83_1751 [Solirubrobacteraceae bacterium]|nr:hypothetical protein [Solirubrobacteraceae bacterium]